MWEGELRAPPQACVPHIQIRNHAHCLNSCRQAAAPSHAPKAAGRTARVAATRPRATHTCVSPKRRVWHALCWRAGQGLPCFARPNACCNLLALATCEHSAIRLQHTINLQSPLLHPCPPAQQKMKMRGQADSPSKIPLHSAGALLLSYDWTPATQALASAAG